MKPKLQSKQETYLQSVHFCGAQPSDLGEISIVVTPAGWKMYTFYQNSIQIWFSADIYMYKTLLVIYEFCSNHDTSNQKAMRVEACKVGVELLKESIDVYVCNDKARRAAAWVLKYAFNILSDAQAGNSWAMKYGNNILLFGRLKQTLVLLNCSLKNRWNNRYNARSSQTTYSFPRINQF